MVQFIQCPVKSVNYGGIHIENYPINIEKCTRIEKHRRKAYPDNEGIPLLFFGGCETEWSFKYDSHRDLVFNKISDNNFDLEGLIEQE